LSKGSVGNICESWSVAECRESVSNCIDQDFEQFPLKIWNATNYEKYVPGKEV
jgi:hypothetical protein